LFDTGLRVDIDRDLAALEKQLASIADKQRKTVKAIAAVMMTTPQHHFSLN
jgi:hypothetical protein